MKTHEFNKIITKLKEVFTVEVDKGDHYFYHIFYKDKYILKTKRSFSGIKAGDVHLIAKQLALSTSQLHSYRRCDLNNKKYLQILLERNKIEGM